MNRVMLEIASLLGANPHMASDIVLDMLANPSLPLVKAVFVRTGKQYGPYEPAANPPLSYSSASVNKLTRQEYVLIQAEGVWLAMNPIHRQNAADNGYVHTELQLQQGGKVEAIKFVRNALGIGLRDAKDLVEAHCSPYKNEDEHST